MSNESQSIQSFLTTVFPKDNLSSLQEKNSESASSGGVSSVKKFNVTLSLPKMTCGGCAASVREFLTSNNLGSDCKIDVSSKTVKISGVDYTELTRVLAKARKENSYFTDMTIKME